MDNERHDPAHHARIDVDVVVIGAGLAGLTAAATAARTGAAVSVLDAHAPGGRARSDERQGYVLNQGPRALYLQGPGAAILAGLGLHPTGAPPARVAAGLRRDRLGLLPTSAASLVRSPLLGAGAKVALARLLSRFARIDAGALADRSGAQWVRSLGLPADAAAVVSTLLRVATYAPDLEVISADAAVRQLQLVQTGGVRYLDGGWSTLVDGLLGAATGAGARLVPGARATGVTDAGDGRWKVATAAGTWCAGAVVIAAGSPAAARAMLAADPGWHLGEDATAACLDLGLTRPPPTPVLFDLDRPLYLSTHAPAARLAPAGAALVHVMRYGARTSDEDRPELQRHAAAAGIGPTDVVVERFLHRMVVSHSLPAPGRGLAGRPPVAVPGRAGVFVAGDWVGPLGLLADASLASGFAAGQAAVLTTGAALTTGTGTGRATAAATAASRGHRAG